MWNGPVGRDRPGRIGVIPDVGGLSLSGCCRDDSAEENCEECDPVMHVTLNLPVAYCIVSVRARTPSGDWPYFWGRFSWNNNARACI
jgi:hypothetical protein